MFTKLRRHAGRNAVAYLALFVALGGSAVAAAPLITGALIRDESVTGADIKDGSLAGADMKDESLAGSDVKNDSLTGSDVNESSLATVPSAVHSDSATDATTLEGMTPSQIAGGSATSAIVWKRARSAGEIAVSGDDSSDYVDLGPSVTVDLPEGGFVVTASIFEARCATPSSGHYNCGLSVDVRRGSDGEDDCGSTPANVNYNEDYALIMPAGPFGAGPGTGSCYVDSGPWPGVQPPGPATFHLVTRKGIGSMTAYFRNRELWVGVVAPPPLEP